MAYSRDGVYIPSPDRGSTPPTEDGVVRWVYHKLLLDINFVSTLMVHRKPRAGCLRMRMRSRSSQRSIEATQWMP